MLHAFRFALPILSVLGSACLRADPAQDSAADVRWQEIKQEILERFPRVDHLSTDQLLEVRDDEERRPLLVDVRSVEEFVVSHLDGALSVPLDGDLNAALADVSKNQPIVVYCSVGYRSADAAQQLTASGFTNVRNYLGSIFEWANRGQPLVNAGGSAQIVHPFDSNWGLLLRPELRSRN